jgi:hypothetical protein
MSVHPEEGRHRGFVHVTDEDVTETRTPTATERQAIELLWPEMAGLHRPRLSLLQWRHVKRLELGLRQHGVPEPRQAHHDTEARR